MENEVVVLPAALYVVATPLGNLADISQRALATLRAVAVVACEDTRHSRRLLDHYGIATRTLALHEHNEASAAERLHELLAAGQSVALVSDAGTPAISDPGARTVAALRARGHRVVPLPGPNAAVTALSAAGLMDDEFHFVGFLPSKSAARRHTLERLRGLAATLVFYEAPHRIEETLGDLVAVLEGTRTLVVARELSKLFEQIVSLPLAEALDWLKADANHQRGEFVLLVSSAPVQPGLSPEALRCLQLLLAELPLKQAVRLAAQLSGASKNALYEEALALRQDTL